ncbi:WD repeat-containing protein 87 [Erinaceus europaeus]|uniref:WD repeat-containing protein 87 n=1 Tax=Erinaceus europaeus TaxID=9365 RepID=A0ABM3WZ71_ERIEU|nr:WD repeat-containing protein 87 [Erinaceus europaeus]
MARPRLIPLWKDFKHLMNEKIDKTHLSEDRNDVVVLSDQSEILFRESRYPQNMPLICHYVTDANFFTSLSWVTATTKEILAIVWIKNKAEDMVEKKMFSMMERLPPIQSMVHTGSFHVMVVYCGDLLLRLFGDHFRAFKPLGIVSCRFNITCLCYDPEMKMLLSGITGAVVTWIIERNGRGLQISHMISMPGDEMIHDIMLNGPSGTLLALCEMVVRVLERQGLGLLAEVKRFTSTTSGSSITCCFTCLDQGFLYAGNTSGEIQVWHLARGHSLHSFKAHTTSVICIRSRPEAHTLLTGGREGTIKEWNLTSGNLLRRLELGEDLYRLEFIDDITFFCQTTHTFSLRRLPCFYSLFNVCGGAPQQLRRIRCSENLFRILCSTEDGLLHFVSPLTGELLAVTWPFSLLDQAVDWAYDPDKEELFVATGTSEVLVFDTTRCPCPAKYLLCTSQDSHDSVQCLAYGHFHLGRGIEGLMFSGHQSGTVRVLSQQHCARLEKSMHFGSVLALSTLPGGSFGSREDALLCSYGMDNFVHLSEAVLEGFGVRLSPLASILSSSHLKHLVLLPQSVGAITENNSLRLWKFNDVLVSGSQQGTTFIETLPLHQCPITSFDVCLSLGIFVTCGMDGSVRVWNFHGRLIARLDSSLHFGPLCFANDRGDLLITFNQSIYLVSCLKLLPPGLLSRLSFMTMSDEVLESPKPFMPSFFLSFEVLFVPKYVYVGHGRQELMGLASLVNRRAIAFDHTVPHVVEEDDQGSPVILSTSIFEPLNQEALVKVNKPYPHYVIPPQLNLSCWDGLNPYQLLKYYFGQGQKWIIAPDCFIPNSVIRACLWPEGSPIFLQCNLHSPIRGIQWDKSEQFFFWQHMTKSRDGIEEHLSVKEDEDFIKHRASEDVTYSVFTDASNRSWLGRKMSEIAINSVIETILNMMVHASPLKYQCCIGALGQIFASYQVSPALRSEAAHRLLDDTTNSNPLIRELAWEGLKRLGMITHLFAIPLAQGLMDKDQRVREKTLSFMPETGIHTKASLLTLIQSRDTYREMQQEMVGEESLDHLLGMRVTDLQLLHAQVEQRLNENMTLSHEAKKPDFTLHITTSAEQEATRPDQVRELHEIPSKPIKVHKRGRAGGKKTHRKLLRGLKKTKEIVSESSVLEGEGDKSESALSEPEETTLFSRLSIFSLTEAETKYLDKDPSRDYITLKMLKKIQDRKGKKKPAQRHTKKHKKKEETEVLTEEALPPEDKEPLRRKRYRGRGASGEPGYKSLSWRDDLCRLMTFRMSGSQTEISRALNSELVTMAQQVLVDQQASWDLFQEICPLLKKDWDVQPGESPSEGAEHEEALLEEKTIYEEPVEEDLVITGRRVSKAELDQVQREERDMKELKETERISKKREKERKKKKKKITFVEPGETPKEKPVSKKEKVSKVPSKSVIKRPSQETKMDKEEKEVTQEERDVTSQKVEEPAKVKVKEEPQEKPAKEEKRLSWKEWKESWDQWKKAQMETNISWNEWKKKWDEKSQEEEGEKSVKDKEYLSADETKPEEKEKKLKWDEWAQVWEKILSEQHLSKMILEKDKDAPVKKVTSEEEVSPEEKELPSEGEEEESVIEQQRQIEQEHKQAIKEKKRARAEKIRAQEERKLAQEEEMLALEERELAFEEKRLARDYRKLAKRDDRTITQIFFKTEEELADREEKLSHKAEKLAQEKTRLARKWEKLAQEEENIANTGGKLAEVKEIMVQKVESMTQKEQELANQEKELTQDLDDVTWEIEELTWKEDELHQEEMGLDAEEGDLIIAEKKVLWQEDRLTKEETKLALEEELLIQEETKLSLDVERLPEEEQRLIQRRRELMAKKEILLQEKELLDQRKEETRHSRKIMDQKKGSLKSRKEKLAQEKFILTKRKENLLQNQESITQNKENLTQAKVKLGLYKERLSNIEKKLVDEKKKHLQKKDKLTTIEKRLTKNGETLARKQQKLYKDKADLAVQKKTALHGWQLVKDSFLINKEQELVMKIKKLAQEKEILEEETAILSRRETQEFPQRHSAETELEIIKHKLSLEEMALVYEDRVIATEQKEVVRGEMEITTGERIYAKEERKLAKVARKLIKDGKSISKEPKESSKLLRTLQKLIKQERRLTREEIHMTKRRRSLFLRERKLSKDRYALDVKESEPSKYQSDIYSDEKKLAKKQRKLAKEMKNIIKKERKLVKEEIILAEKEREVKTGEEEALSEEEDDTVPLFLKQKLKKSKELESDVEEQRELPSQLKASEYEDSFTEEVENLLAEMERYYEYVSEEEEEEILEEEEQEEVEEEEVEEIQELQTDMEVEEEEEKYDEVADEEKDEEVADEEKDEEVADEEKDEEVADEEVEAMEEMVMEKMVMEEEKVEKLGEEVVEESEEEEEKKSKEEEEEEEEEEKEMSEEEEKRTSEEEMASPSVQEEERSISEEAGMEKTMPTEKLPTLKEKKSKDLRGRVKLPSIGERTPEVKHSDLELKILKISPKKLIPIPLGPREKKFPEPASMKPTTTEEKVTVPETLRAFPWLKMIHKQKEPWEEPTSEQMTEFSKLDLHHPLGKTVKPRRLQDKPARSKRLWFLGQRPPLLDQLRVPAEETLEDVSRSDVIWLYRTIAQMQAGEELPRASFHRLCQLLKDLTSQGNLEWIHQALLKSIVHRHSTTLESQGKSIFTPRKEPRGPKSLKVIPPIKRKETESRLTLLAAPTPKVPLATKRIQDLKARDWPLLEEPYRSVWAQQVSQTLQEMEMTHFHPASRAAVEKQTWALVFQKDFRTFREKSRHLRLPKLEKVQPTSKEKEEVPPWETFVALYYVLQMFRERYGEDSMTWREQFYHLMDLYQIKSLRIQRLLQELVQRKEFRPKGLFFREALHSMELGPGERLIYHLLCDRSSISKKSLAFQEVVPLPEQNSVRAILPIGIAQYGILELAWKSLPQADVHLTKKLPHIIAPTP